MVPSSFSAAILTYTAGSTKVPDLTAELGLEGRELRNVRVLDRGDGIAVDAIFGERGATLGIRVRLCDAVIPAVVGVIVVAEDSPAGALARLVVHGPEVVPHNRVCPIRLSIVQPDVEELGNVRAPRGLGAIAALDVVHAAIVVVGEVERGDHWDVPPHPLAHKPVGGLRSTLVEASNQVTVLAHRLQDRLPVHAEASAGSRMPDEERPRPADLEPFGERLEVRLHHLAEEEIEVDLDVRVPSHAVEVVILPRDMLIERGAS